MPLYTGSLSDEPRQLNPDGAEGRRRLLRSARKLKRQGFEKAAEELAARGGLASARSGGISSAEDKIASQNAAEAFGRFDRATRMKQALAERDSTQAGPAAGGTATSSGGATAEELKQSRMQQYAGQRDSRMRQYGATPPSAGGANFTKGGYPDVSSRLAASGRAEMERDKSDAEGRATLRAQYERVLEANERAGVLRDLSTVNSAEDITRKNAEIDARSAARRAAIKPVSGGESADDILKTISSARAGIAEELKGSRPTSSGSPVEQAGPSRQPTLSGPPKPIEQAGPAVPPTSRLNAVFQPAPKNWRSQMKTDIAAEEERRKRTGERVRAADKQPMPRGVAPDSIAASALRAARRYAAEINL
jgi:hypothetical protein